MATIALVGATGNFGHKLLPILSSESSFAEIRSLSRHARSSPDLPKIKSVKVDFTDSTSLENALRGCDALINAMGTNLDHLSSKKALVDAAAKVGVKIYIPRCGSFPDHSLIASEFGVDPHVDSEFIRHPMWDTKKSHDTYAESKGLKVISI